jgi:hypothetical protein
MPGADKNINPLPLSLSPRPQLAGLSPLHYTIPCCLCPSLTNHSLFVSEGILAVQPPGLEQTTQKKTHGIKYAFFRGHFGGPGEPSFCSCL